MGISYGLLVVEAGASSASSISVTRSDASSSDPNDAWEISTVRQMRCATLMARYCDPLWRLSCVIDCHHVFVVK